MPSAAAQDVLQAILERRAAEKRRTLGATAAPMVLPFAQRAPLKVYLNAGERDRAMGDQAPLPFSNRIAGAFDASEGMPEPSQALYAAKHQRAMDVLGNRSPEGPGFRDAIASLASLGPRAWGGAQKMWQAAPMAAEALYNDPLGSINSVGLAGQAATDAIVQGMVRPFAQFGDPNVDPIENAADIALTAMGGSSVVPAEANSLRMGIKAYHGSPHSFERFDSSKIGTGEGAQAYGHGLYFAEREGVAKEYRDSLSDAEWTVGGKPYDAKNPEHFAAAHLKEFASTDAAVQSLKRGIEHLRGINAEWAPPAIAQKQETLRLIKRGGLPAIDEKPLGKMYEVDIAADPEHFLDWDKPLSEQSPQVREKLLQTGDPAKVKALEAEHRQAYDAYMSRPENTSTGDLHRMERRVEQTYDAWRKEIGNAAKSGAGVYSELAGGGKFATGTEKLKEMGIPGIKYLDQGSRDPQKMKELADDLAQYKEAAKHWAETGNSEKLAIAQKQIEVLTKRISETRNYVVFDDRLISILKKYGLPISAAGLAALSQLHPQEAQAAQQRK